MIDRKKAPAIKRIDSIKLPDVISHRLDNGIVLYEIPMGTQDVVKLEVVFHAGRPFERKQLAAKATCNLLREGTAELSGASLADMLDYYGSALNYPFQMDTGNIVLYTLSKHFPTLLPVVYQVISAPLFSDQELEAYQSRSQNKLRIDLAKNEILAYRKITEFIFGSHHPYGYNSSVAKYQALQKADLLEHHNRCYTAANCTIFLSGKTNGDMITQINDCFSRLPVGQPQKVQFPATENLSEPRTVFIQQKDSVQTSIRIGQKLFPQSHPDFHRLSVLNTVLGGYFGSRLMTNIREEKGYTYNIFSMLDNFVHDGYLYVAAEVGNDFVDPTLREIWKEIDRLQQELIDEEELEMVKNYLLGTYLTTVDGPFNASEVVRNLIIEQLPLERFTEMIKEVQQTEAEDLQVLARRYLNQEQMWQVIVGN